MKKIEKSLIYINSNKYNVRYFFFILIIELFVYEVYFFF